MGKRTMDNWGKIRYALITVFAVAFMFCVYSISSFAAEGKITAPSAKIRESASTTSAHIGSALINETYTIQGQETGSDGMTWYKVTFEENKTGYIRSDLISVSGDVPASTTTAATYNPTVEITDLVPVSAKVTGSTVRIRPDAAASGGVVTSVQKDTVLTIDGRATGSDGKVWYRVNSTVSGAQVLGFIREDFVKVEGDILTVEEHNAQQPSETPQDPVTPVDPVEPEETKAYETVYENDKWYLLNNEENEKYVIDDLFTAVKTNADLAEKHEKTAKTQKGFIIVLVILLVFAVAAAAFLAFKLKDMLDEVYFKQVEKKTLSNRSSSPKRVMHTVGDERRKQGPGNGQTRRPAQGQGQRPAQRPAGEGVRKPVSQTRPNGEAPRKSVARPEGTGTGNRPVQSQQAEPVRQQMPKAPTQAQATRSQQAKPQQAKPQQPGWQSKNFMTDDDEFEFEFLNWDGEEDL